MSRTYFPTTFRGRQTFILFVNLIALPKVHGSRSWFFLVIHARPITHAYSHYSLPIFPYTTHSHAFSFARPSFFVSRHFPSRDFHDHQTFILFANLIAIPKSSWSWSWSSSSSMRGSELHRRIIIRRQSPRIAYIPAHSHSRAPYFFMSRTHPATFRSRQTFILFVNLIAPPKVRGLPRHPCAIHNSIMETLPYHYSP
jgi:hypothetical protein